MCPGFLWFTFIRHSLVTHDSRSHTVSGYTIFQSKSRPQFFQQSATLHSLHSLRLYLSMWNELCNFFFFSFAYLFDLWIHFVVCCSFCAVTYQKRKMFFLCKGTKKLFFFQCVKSRVECWNIRLAEKNIFPPLPKWYAKFH